MTERPPVAPFTARQIAWRLFFTSWILFTIHFAPDIVREVYPAIALGDKLTFRVDEYGGLHPDLFETPGRGWHIGNNPGVSMLAAIPYALARPVIDPIVRRVQAKRQESGATEPPAYNTPRRNARSFYAEAWRRGLDIKLFLGAFVTQAFCMAPSSALAVVLMFFVLRRVLRSDQAAMWLSLVYAVGTPVMYRTGFLNHNLMLGHIAFAGFVALWHPFGRAPGPLHRRALLAGLAGGAAVLFDYSGIVLIGGLWAYALWVNRREGSEGIGPARTTWWYAIGAAGPILLLWWYQYRAFGNPFLPGQHWMPPVEWIDRGYRGFGGPQLEILGPLLWDYRYGLFTSAPLFLLALAWPFRDKGPARLLPLAEGAAMLLLVFGLWLFFGGNNYTRLQWNTGIRYLAPTFPFLFVPAAVVLYKMRPPARYMVALAGVALAWPLAMYRQVQWTFGLLDPLLRTYTAGPTLPVLITLGQTTGQYGDFWTRGTSPLMLFVLTGAVLYGIWRPWGART